MSNSIQHIVNKSSVAWVANLDLRIGQRRNYSIARDDFDVRRPVARPRPVPQQLQRQFQLATLGGPARLLPSARALPDAAWR